MKQTTSEADLHFLFNEKEKEVVRILLDLKWCKIQGFWPLTWASEENLWWGAKRQRSATAAPAPVPSGQRRTSSQTDCGMNTGGQVKVEATSPATPLAFSPSESDDKSTHCLKKSSKKRSRDELLKTVNELTDNKIALSRELERVKSHYNSILAYNRELKAMKKQVNSSSVILSHKTEGPQSEMNRSYHLGQSNTRNSCYQISLVSVALPPPRPQPQQPAAMGVRQQITTAPLVSSNSGGLDRGNHVVGPVGCSNNMPDLINGNNLPTEGSLSFGRVESLFRPLDYSRARAAADLKAKYAAARWERRMKRKFKYHRK